MAAGAGRRRCGARSKATSSNAITIGCKPIPSCGAAPTDVVVPVADPGFFAAALASASGLLREEQAELHAGAWPASWKGALPALIVDLWTSLSRITTWNPAVGHAPPEGPGNPYPSAYLLAMLLLSRLPEDSWATPPTSRTWIAERHPFWLGKKPDTLGIAHVPARHCVFAAIGAGDEGATAPG